MMNATKAEAAMSVICRSESMNYSLALRMMVAERALDGLVAVMTMVWV